MVDLYRETIATTRPLAQGEAQTHEGGIAFVADDWARLRRFLILGSESGTFYVGAKELSADNVSVVQRCLDADWQRTLETIREVSQGGLAHKNEPAILALAIASASKNQETREAALYLMLPKVCRTGTHLLHFVAYCKAIRKSSRMWRTAVGNWFNTKDSNDLAYQAVKYKNRDGWAMADVLRLARPSPQSAAHSAIYKWLVDGELSMETPRLIREAEDIGLSNDAGVEAQRIRDHRIPREAVPTEWLNEVDIWEALLEDMPMTAMIRNLAKMTAIGLIAPGSNAEQKVVAQLAAESVLHRARVHPLSLLLALKVYEQGHGDKGSLSWTPSKRIINALDESFYAAFKNVTSTGKRIRLALDVSASMDGNRISGTVIDARMASAAMALVTAAVEPNASFVAYSSQLVPVNIRPSMRLDDVMRTLQRIPMGGTICHLPIQEAMQGRESYDAFVSYTDSETGGGSYGYVYKYGGSALGSYSDALSRYRSEINPQARSVVVGLTAGEFTLNDPADLLGLDVAGFDASAPALIGGFIAGEL
jgi:60 kDa SS-A/Ro ribonucleoprotein